MCFLPLSLYQQKKESMMSLNSLTNDELRRERMMEPATAAARPVEVAADTVPPRAAEEDNKVTSALEILTESITLYVAAVSAAPAIASITGGKVTGVILYWGFAVLTPLLLLLVLMSKRASDGQPPVPKRWPWWKLVAATIAFLVWALAVPNNPYVQGDAAAVVAGFGAILISSVLSLLEPIFDRPASS
jgi:hypothetical protein